MQEPEGEPHGSSVIRFSVGSRDTVSPALIDRVRQAADQAEDAGGEAVVLVRLHPGGDGDKGRAAGVPVHLVNQWERMLRRIEWSPAGTVAAVHGECSGPAAEMLLATDLRIAATDLSFRLTGDPLQQWPGAALYRLVAQIGLARSRQLALFGGELSAKQSLDWCIVNQTCPLTALDACADAAVRRLSGLSGKDLAIRRRLLFDAVGTSFDEALGAHLAACDRTLRPAATSPTHAAGAT